MRMTVRTTNAGQKVQVVLLFHVSRDVQEEPQWLLENHRRPGNQSNRECPVMS